MANGVNTKLAAINAVLDNIYARLGVMNENQASYADAADTFYANFLTLSGFLQLAIGTFSEAEPGTVLYTLRRIAVCICMLAGGSPPSETAPEDNILQAIRGDVEADADRNVVELLI